MERLYWLNLQTEYDMRMVTRESRDKIAPRSGFFSLRCLKVFFMLQK
ncbi:hypothetical protein [Polaromonas sp.]|nr:hypothetical protein [Polaromonas sp.]